MNSRALRLVDRYAGTLLYILLFLASKLYKPRTFANKRILAIKLWAVGETVLVLPALRELKEKGYTISFLSTPNNRDIAAASGLFDEVICFDPKEPAGMVKTIRSLRERRYGIAMDFEPYARFSAILSYISGAGRRIGFANRPLLYTDAVFPDERMHAVANFARLANVLEEIRMPESLVPLRPSNAARRWVDAFLKKRGIRNGDVVVGIHAGSGASSVARRWREEKFGSLCRNLAEKYNAKVVLVGNETGVNRVIHSMAPGTIDASRKMRIEEIAAFMEQCALCIANDSGIMHIAAAMGTPTIGLFGPNTPDCYGPYGKRCVGLYKGPGTPLIRPFRAQFPETFEINYMDKITVDDVMAAAKKLLASRPGARIRRT
ncbi:MAG: glycosyltransferase family 9 protein [Candidatus Aenigmarchaeota archaeon]|nr:glycosyltransferase family 9 protein [Candidatus Aenigmarchaeota archaeon]